MREFSHNRENFGSHLELAGTFLLLSLKGRLIEIGEKYIKEIANILVHSPNKGGVVEPWWKRLKAESK